MGSPACQVILEDFLYSISMCIFSLVCSCKGIVHQKCTSVPTSLSVPVLEVSVLVNSKFCFAFPLGCFGLFQKT